MDELTKQVKLLLKIDDTDIYDEELEIEINSSISQLEIGGIPWEWVQTKIGTPYFSNYATCVTWLCSSLIDQEVDINKLQRYYTTNMNQLRTWYSYEMSKNA